jgi:hypothetical protein
LNPLDTGEGEGEGEGEPPPALTILSPNGGEVFLQGDELPILWTSTDPPETTVSIWIKNTLSTYPREVASAIPNTGSYTRIIPVTFPVGDYTTRILNDTTFAEDSSDAAWTIDASVP